MRGHRGLRAWAVRLPIALLAMGLVGLVAAPAALAAAPNKSLTPYVSCYFDNRNGTITVSVGVTNSTASTVTAPVGPDNHITVGAQDRGQPTSFLPGKHDNIWAATVTYDEIGQGIDWSLTGNTATIASFDECATKPVPANGNTIAMVAFGAASAVVGGIFLNGRRKRAHVGEPA